MGGRGEGPGASQTVGGKAVWIGEARRGNGQKQGERGELGIINERGTEGNSKI